MFCSRQCRFLEDTPDGKGTTHGTITVIYQKDSAHGDPVAPPVSIKDTNSMTVTPYHTPLIPCSKPKLPPVLSPATANQSFKLSGGIR